MSDFMFDEVELIGGKKYMVGDWKRVATHDEQNIKGFFGPYRFLSNFQLCEIYFEGEIYPSTECAYQAAKVLKSFRKEFTTCSAAESKKLWKKFPSLYKTAQDWDSAKDDIMMRVVSHKFLEDKNLRQKLVETGDKYLEELNWWSDTHWGVDIILGGENNLGKLLMKVRDLVK